ncbi:arginase family protein, partial [Arthrospira platensis SPKY1]|nr:arginase family protein [Arthrospira platensis SPKY1]
FRQIAEWCAAHDRLFDYRVFGISRYANTQALFERAEALGVRYLLDEALQSESDVVLAREALQRDLDTCEAVYLTVCLDVLPGGQAPGVSAPAALGVPLAHVQSLIHTVLASGKLAIADIA